MTLTLPSSSFSQLQNKIAKKVELFSFSSEENKKISDLLSQIPFDIQLEGNYITPQPTEEQKSQKCTKKNPSVSTENVQKIPSPVKNEQQFIKQNQLSQKPETQEKQKTQVITETNQTKPTNLAPQKIEQQFTNQSNQKAPIIQNNTPKTPIKEQNKKETENLDDWLDDLLG